MRSSIGSNHNAGSREGSFWIGWLSGHTTGVLLVGVLLSLASLALFFQFGALNSDLSKLIKPSDSLPWYQHNERYKAAFPQYQQTAVIVVRGADYQQVLSHTKRLVGRLPKDVLGEVFAPGVHPFLLTRKPYFLTLDQLEQWLRGAQYNQGSLLRLADEATLANVLFTYADFISANPGQTLPISLESVKQGIVRGELAFRSHYPLHPEGDLFSELIIVSGQQQLDDALPNAAIVAALEQVINEVTPPKGVEVALTGEIALAHEEMSAALGGVELAGLLSLVFLAVILHLGIRSAPILVAIATMLAMGVSLTLGFATLAVGELNTLSMIFVVLFFGLGVDFGAHFTLRVQSCLQGDLKPALTQALQETGPALILCTLTSAGSFLAFLPTAYRGFAELGIISAGGIFIALALTLTVIPAVLLRWPPEPQDPARKMLITPALRKLRTAIDRLPGHLVVGCFALVSLGAVWLAKDVRFDYSVLAMRDAQAPSMRALLELQENQQTTDYSVHVLVADANAARDLKDQLLALATVGAVATPADFVPDAQTAKAALLRAQLEVLPDVQPSLAPSAAEDDTAMAIQYLAIVADELSGESKRQAMEVLAAAQEMVGFAGRRQEFEQQLAVQMPAALNAFSALLAAQPFTLADVPESFRSRLVTADGQHLLSVNPASQLNDRQATDAFIAEVSSAAPNAAGRSVVEWGVGAVVVESFQQATATAFASIFLLLLVYFRGWKYPLLVLTPIAVTVVLTFAICVLLGISLNMANILMVPLILGLGVDTGIHIVHRHRQMQMGAEAMDPAIRRAVMISGLTTVGTFCSLSLSPHQGAASIGLLLTVAIGLLLIISLTLMPILLRRFAPVPQPR